MTRETIDQRTVTRALKQARKTHARVVVRDSMKAFALRISATGVIAYTLQYRDADGRQRLYTLPESECSTPLQARACAESLRNRIRDGSFDPLRARRVGHERQEAERKARHTVAELCDVWLERRTDKRSLSGDRSVINAHVKPKLGHFRLDELTRRDVADAMKAIAPKIYQANRFHSLVTSLLNFAGTGSVSGHEGLGWLKPAVNVAKGIRRDHEEPRDQVLSPDQLQRLLAVIDRIGDTPSARAVRSLMFTLARKNEVLGARWSEFSLETEPAFWTKPSSRGEIEANDQSPARGRRFGVAPRDESRNLCDHKGFRRRLRLPRPRPLRPSRPPLLDPRTTRSWPTEFAFARPASRRSHRVGLFRRPAVRGRPAPRTRLHVGRDRKVLPPQRPCRRRRHGRLVDDLSKHRDRRHRSAEMICTLPNL